MTDVRTLSDKADLPKNTDVSSPENRASAEAQVLMREGNSFVPATNLDTSIWPDVELASADAQQAPRTKGIPGTTPADKLDRTPPADKLDRTSPSGDQTSLDRKNCRGTASFNILIDTAASLIYDPSQLGDLGKLKADNACVPTVAEAVKRADAAVAVADDPYTDVLEYVEAREQQTAFDGHLSGVGVLVARPGTLPTAVPDKPSPVEVLQVYRNSPAYDAGLKKGDLITSINGKDVTSMPSDDMATQLLRGPEGTEAKISLLRDGKPLEFDVTRKDYTIPSVLDEKRGDYAYIRFEDMSSEMAADELKAALERHQRAKGFILDLRGNGGGQLGNALLSSSLIMDKGEIMSVKARQESDPADPKYDVERYLVTESGILTTGDNVEDVKQVDGRYPDLVDKPLVVLTDGSTASAAEILAGALKDNKEAVLIGEKTFGKGVGQIVIPDMPGQSSLSVTNFRFFTPSGQWIGDGHNNRTGISPNIEVKNPEGEMEFGSDRDLQYQTAVNELNKLTKTNK